MVSETSKKWLGMLGMPKSGHTQSFSQKFCNLSTLSFEPDTKFPTRQKFWTWMVQCLHGPKTTPGPYFYLTKQVPVYDISGLFKRLTGIMETVTICSLDDEVYTVTHLDFDQTKHDLFGYVEELRVALQRLQDVNDRLPEAARVNLSETYLKSRIVRAARVLPVYKHVIDNLVALPVNEWGGMSINELLKKFESANANDIALQPRRNVSTSVTSSLDDTVQANYIEKSAQKNQKEKTCFQFKKTGSCSKTECPYTHSKADPEQKN
jgi:hypothetical protein